MGSFLINAEAQSRRVRRVFWGCLRQRSGVSSQESVRRSRGGGAGGLPPVLKLSAPLRDITNAEEIQKGRTPLAHGKPFLGMIMFLPRNGNPAAGKWYNA